MAWHEWQEGATEETLHGSHLNENFDVLSDLVAAGITGGNFATGAVNAGTIIADDVVGDQHLNWGDANYSPKCVKIGGEINTYQQFMCRGIVTVIATTATYTDITVHFSNGVGCVGGEPTFIAAPFATAEVVANTTAYDANIYAIGTDTMIVRVRNRFDTAAGTIVAGSICWIAMGDI